MAAVPFPQASCVEAGLHRALFTTGTTHKAQSEQHRGGTSEARKEQESQRGRRKGRVEKAEREEEGQNGRGKTHEFWHTSLSQGVGLGTAEGQARLSPTDCRLPLNVTAAP